MKRYNSIQQIKRWDGKRTYVTTYYPEILPDESDIYVISNESDYLDTLAHKYYGDPTLWFIIAIANDIGKGRLSIDPGTQLRIPMNIGKILSDYQKINS